jgi:hypothetical protein
LRPQLSNRTIHFPPSTKNGTSKDPPLACNAYVYIRILVGELERKMSFDDLVALATSGLGQWIVLKNGTRVYQQGEETRGTQP